MLRRPQTVHCTLRRQRALAEELGHGRLSGITRGASWRVKGKQHDKSIITRLLRFSTHRYYQTKAAGNIKNWYFVRRKDKGLLYLAALYYGDGTYILRCTGYPNQHEDLILGELNAFAIITTNACEALQGLHHEQAVILQPGAVSRWLDASDPEWTPAHDSAILDPYNNGSTPIES